MDITERLEALTFQVETIKKLDPTNFGKEPVSSFIDALVKDLNKIIDEYLDD